MRRNVSVDSEYPKYCQRISIGPHSLRSDEPAEYGGNDTGPTAIELLLASLATCAATTAQMYAERKGWALHGVHVDVSHARVLAGNDNQSGAKIAMVDQIDIGISFMGDLSDDQLQRLFEIANRCPVHRMLVSEVRVQPKLLTQGSIETKPYGGAKWLTDRSYKSYSCFTC
jgi:putative redox protein